MSVTIPWTESARLPLSTIFVDILYSFKAGLLLASDENLYLGQKSDNKVKLKRVS